MYTVAALVVVTLALLADNVGRWNACPTQLVAVPLPAVLLSVQVEAAQFEIPPVVPGVPDLLPAVKLHPIVEVLCAVVTPAESRVCAYPSQSNAPPSGEINEAALLRMLSNSALRSAAVRTSVPHTFTRESAMVHLPA